MRITSTMASSALIQQSNVLQSQEYTIENQEATQMQFLNPSDNPTAFAQVSGLRGDNAQANSYLGVSNTLNLAANDTYQGMTNLQTILSSVSEIMTEANTSSSQSELQIYGGQLQSYAQQILAAVNAKGANGDYVYGGVGNQPPLIAETSSTNTFASAIAGLSPSPDTLTVNGASISVTSTDTVASLQAKLNHANTGVTVSTDPATGNLSFSSTTGDISMTDAGNFLTGLGYTTSPVTATIQLNNTSNGYTGSVTSATINTNLTVSLGLTAGSNTSGAGNFAGFLTDGTAGATDLYNMVVNASNDLLNASGSDTDAFSSDATLGSSYASAVSSFNDAIDNVSTYVGRASAQLALLSTNQQDLNNTISNQKQSLSGLTSLDTATAAINLSNVQTAYSSALSAGSKILNMSLLNYLS